ncbi:hypothetical protein [Fluviicola sp.]|uniref:hypothetical protein n=1 Tax=Fluviicola sp. TaxID=1917219 RepID=UPI0031E063C9
MTILFGWKQFRLKSYTFQELHLPELEQFPNATFQVSQTYFHLFYIPICPTGRRYHLVMDGKLYAVPPSLMKMVDPELVKARGKWYAWSLPLLILVIMLGVKIKSAIKENEYEQYSMEFAEMEQEFFNDPEVGDHLLFTNKADVEFDAEVFKVAGKKVTLFVNLMKQLDDEVLEEARSGKAAVDADSIQALIDQRNALVETSRFNDSLRREYIGQPVLQKVLMFELESYPIRYKVVEMSLDAYQAMKKSLADGSTKKATKIKIPALHAITKQALFVEPLYE